MWWKNPRRSKFGRWLEKKVSLKVILQKKVKYLVQQFQNYAIIMNTFRVHLL